MIEHIGRFASPLSLSRRGAPVAAVLSLVIFLLGGPTRAHASPSVTTNWKQERFGAAHTGVNPHETILSSANVADLVSKWAVNEDVRVQSSPAVVDGVVYGAGGDLSRCCASHVFALDAATGETLWRARQPDAVDAPGIAVCGGRVFLATLLDHILRAYDAATGRRLWTLHTDGAPNSPTLARGLLYTQTNLGIVYAVDPVTGQVVWHKHQAGFTTASPTVYRGVVYVAGFDNREVRALDAGDGHLVWKSGLPDTTQGTVAVADGLLYEAVAEAGVFALSASTGAIIWHQPTGQGTDNPPTVDGRAVYIGDVHGNLYAFNRATGHPLWTASLGGRFTQNSTVLANGVLYAGTTGVFALDARTGDTLWSAPTGTVGTDPAVVNGVVYVGDFNGDIQAFHLSGS